MENKDLNKQTKKEHSLLSKDDQNIIDDILINYDINVNNGVDLNIVLSCDLAMREYAKIKNIDLQSKYDNLLNIIHQASDVKFANFLFKKGLTKFNRSVELKSEYMKYLGSLDPRTKA